MSLSKELLEKQKQALLEEKAHTIEKIKQFKQFPDYGWDEEDNIGELTDFENNQPLEEQMESTLKKINYALEAIENGTYGLCSKCKKAIETDRLEIMPYANICISCTSKK